MIVRYAATALIAAILVMLLAIQASDKSFAQRTDAPIEPSEYESPLPPYELIPGLAPETDPQKRAIDLIERYTGEKIVLPEPKKNFAPPKPKKSKKKNRNDNAGGWIFIIFLIAVFALIALNGSKCAACGRYLAMVPAKAPRKVYCKHCGYVAMIKLPTGGFGYGGGGYGDGGGDGGGGGD